MASARAARPGHLSGRRSALGAAVLLAHEAQQADEDVEPVQVDGQRGVDCVVERPRQAHRPVPVVHDHPREDHDTHPVEQGQRAPDVETEEACDRHDEVADEQEQHRGEEPRAEALQVVRDDRADDAEHGDDDGRDEEHLDHTRRGVLRHHRPEHEPERDGDQCVAEQGDGGVVALDGDEAADEGHDKNAEHESHQSPRGLELEVVGELRRAEAGEDPQEREPCHREGEQVLGHGVGRVAVATAVPYLRREAHGLVNSFFR
jgi:hypothetical protein